MVSGVNRSFVTVFRVLGPLRIALAIGTLLIAAVGPFVSDESDIHSWRFLPDIIAPTLMVVLAFVLPLDMTMARIFMVDALPPERARYRNVIRIEAVLLLLMLLAWLPFVATLLGWTTD